mmetsp:Transcript_29868/g.63304  ORF Transcript_29868/g.63304 Transcript_29868/m.63304 type:complete len:201 (-) Transcript_29868:276-878(-)
MLGERVIAQRVSHLHSRLNFHLQFSFMTEGTEQIGDRVNENGTNEPIIRDKTVGALPRLRQALQDIGVQVVAKPEGIHGAPQGLILLDVPVQHRQLPAGRGHRRLAVRKQEDSLHAPHPIVTCSLLALQPAEQAVPDVGVPQGLQVVQNAGGGLLAGVVHFHQLHHCLCLLVVLHQPQPIVGSQHLDNSSKGVLHDVQGS